MGHLILRFLILSTAIAFIYIAGISVYNVFLHPYAKYPGPFWAKISPLYALWHSYAGDLHIDVLQCHEKYGDIVRYTPDRIVVNTVQGLKDIYGQGKNLQKSRGYSPHPYFPKVFNTHNCIDKSVHGRKRRIVSQGFSESTIASSERYVLDHVRALCESLVSEKDPGKDGWSTPRDMAVWNVISDLTFGQSFNMIGKPDLRWLVNAIVNGNRHIYMRFQFPALFNVKPTKLYSPARWLFPKMEEERAQFSAIASKYSRDRMAMLEEGKSERQDIMSALLAARDPKTGEKLSEEEVWGEAHLMIAAGGDTTSTALAAILFYLSRCPRAYQRLATEIRTTFSTMESIRRSRQLSSCHYLSACIDEALRLAPAAPGALWREVCPGGAIIDGHYIPAGYDAAVCVYALSHNPKHFEDPFAFKPERFLSEEQGSFPRRTQSPLLRKTARQNLNSPTRTEMSSYFDLPLQEEPSLPSLPSPPIELSNLPSPLPSPSPSFQLHPSAPQIMATIPRSFPSPLLGTTPLSCVVDAMSTPSTPMGLPRSQASTSSTIASSKDAFAPFSLGPRSCLAKPLAYLELTLATAWIIWLMDFESVDQTGEGGPGLGKGRERPEEFQITDMFSSNKQGPVLRFKSRRARVAGT